jgi:glycosyltransferase involved in cell wall biosynthesis
VLENAGVRVLPYSKHFRARTTFSRLLVGLLGLVQAYLSERPQIVHFYLPRAYILGSLLAFMTRRRRLIMSRRSLNNYQQKHRTLTAIELRLHSAMTAIVGNSQRVIEQLREEEHVTSNKLFLIYNGIPIEPFKRPFDKNGKRAELGLTNETLVLLTVANLIRYKGHEDLLKAIQSIKSDLPQNWVLLIVGRDDGLGNKLNKRTKDLGLTDYVRFLGERPDVIDLLRIADIGLLCSHEEGFSNALLEKMAAGLPCVATDVGGNAEAMIDEITGLLVPAKDPGAIARAILRLARDPILRQQMGAAGYRRVCQFFPLEACVDGYEALYSSILGNEILHLRSGGTCRPRELGLHASPSPFSLLP